MRHFSRSYPPFSGFWIALQRPVKSLLFFLVFSFSISWAQGRSCFEQLKSFRERNLSRNTTAKIDAPLFDGMEQVDQLIRVSSQTREEIRQKNFDFKTTSLKSLDPVVQNLVEYLSAAEKNLPIWTLSSRRKLFENFRLEATSRLQNQQVTYEWLILFSYRVSILSDAFTVRKFNPEIPNAYWKTHEATLDYLENHDVFDNFFNTLNFDKVLVLPFTKDLGIYGMNRLIAQGIAPIGHIYKNLVVDGISYSPFTFWKHDLGHAINSGIKSPNFVAFAHQFLSAAELLPPEKRIQMEYLFFYFTHEAAVLNGDFKSRVKNIETALHALTNRERSLRFLTHASQNPGHFGNILTLAGVDIKNDAAVDQWLLEGMKAFLNQVEQTEKSIQP